MAWLPVWLLVLLVLAGCFIGLILSDHRQRMRRLYRF